MMLFFICCVLFQVIYQCILLCALIKKKNKIIAPLQQFPSVSIVICARNETENLTKNLPFIFHQQYPDFEIILVDDGSDIPIQLQHERLTIIKIDKNEKIGIGKKYAIQKGISQAKNSLIVLTDADCKPLSNKWITSMVNGISDTHKIVLGISPYQKTDTFLNGIIEYETAQTAWQYCGFALLGMPYMSVGRNVIYDAKLLKSKSWSTQEFAIASGDDDLAIQSLSTAGNTSVSLSLDSYTISEAKQTLKDWYRQKIRHYESGHLYKYAHQLVLGAYLVSKFLMYFLCLIIIISCSVFSLYFLGILIGYFIIITMFNFQLHKKFQLNHRWYFSAINDILYSIFTTVFGIISFIKSTRDWK